MLYQKQMKKTPRVRRHSGAGRSPGSRVWGQLCGVTVKLPVGKHRVQRCQRSVERSRFRITQPLKQTVKLSLLMDGSSNPL